MFYSYEITKLPLENRLRLHKNYTICLLEIVLKNYLILCKFLFADLPLKVIINYSKLYIIFL